MGFQSSNIRGYLGRKLKNKLFHNSHKFYFNSHGSGAFGNQSVIVDVEIVS